MFCVVGSYDVLKKMESNSVVPSQQVCSVPLSLTVNASCEYVLFLTQQTKPVKTEAISRSCISVKVMVNNKTRDSRRLHIICSLSMEWVKSCAFSAMNYCGKE